NHRPTLLDAIHRRFFFRFPILDVEIEDRVNGKLFRQPIPFTLGVELPYLTFRVFLIIRAERKSALPLSVEVQARAVLSAVPPDEISIAHVSHSCSYRSTSDNGMRTSRPNRTVLSAPLYIKS